MAMTPAEYTAWKALMDQAISDFNDAVAARNAHTKTADAVTAASYTATLVSTDSNVSVAANAIDALNAKYAAAAAVPYDTTPPTVYATDPVDGQIMIFRNKAIAVTFDGPMDPATITSASVLLVAKEGGASGLTQTGNPTLDETRTIATITHTTGMAATATYKIKVTQAVRDVHGNYMVSVYQQPTGFVTGE